MKIKLLCLKSNIELGIIRNHYVGRTFIEPTQQIRSLGVKLKHNVNKPLIKNKTLIIWGDKDKSYNLGQAQTLEKNISDSNLVIFKGCAHNVHLEQPDQFNHTIKDFLL
jgi:pimeloyl-ACP methyl ester carboxylesterase